MLNPEPGEERTIVPDASFSAVGVIALWSGSEAALSVGNPVVLVDSTPRATHGEAWNARTGIASSDVADDPGYRPFPSTVNGVSVGEGEIAWMAGRRFIESYLEYVAASGRDLLNLGEWHFLEDGSALRFGLAVHFYRLSAKLAQEALKFYEPLLVEIDMNPTMRKPMDAARSVYAGCHIADIGVRRVSDAYWYQQNGDFDMYKRAITQAVILGGVSEHEVVAAVKERLDYYEDVAYERRASAQVRELMAENERLKAIVAAQQAPTEKRGGIVVGRVRFVGGKDKADADSVTVVDVDPASIKGGLLKVVRPEKGVKNDLHVLHLGKNSIGSILHGVSDND